MLYCSTTLAQEPDPESDPNLLWKTNEFYLRFLVHPNGNILAGAGHVVEEGSKEFELDGNTGMIMREFTPPLYFFDISPDGKYISAIDKSTQRCVIDYETGEVVKYFSSTTYPKFMPDSRTLIYTIIEPIGELNGNNRLQSYNIETGEYKTSKNMVRNTTTRLLAVSPNGQYVATGGTFYGTDGNNYSRLILWNAETLDTIRILGDIESMEVRSIKFSPDSKLVGFVVYSSNLYIYKTDDFSLYRNYNQSNGNFPSSGFGFITNDYLALGDGYATPPAFNLVKLENEQIIYSKNDFAGISEYNQVYNSMIVNHGVIYSFDFEKILSGASITPEIPSLFSVEYMTNTLFIKNHNFTSLQLSAQITDINGRIIRNIDLHTSTGDIRIPIKLLSGTYFLHIKAGNKEYVSKFLVTN